MPRTITFLTAAVLTLLCATRALAVEAERVVFDGATQRLVSGGLIVGDRIEGHLARPEGAGPFPAVVALHGCGGMFDTTKRKLIDDLVGWGYVVLLVDSFATRGIEHACTGGYSDIPGMRRADAYGALAFLARQSFVDPGRVAAVGFSQGAWVGLLLAEANSFESFIGLGDLRFRATVALYPICKGIGRLVLPTLILIGALDDWTPAADCSEKVGFWGTDGAPIELVVYPGIQHSFYYPELQGGRRAFGHWLEYNEAAATDATRRMREFLARHLK